MRALIQRVKEGQVEIKDRDTAAIGQGLVVLLGVAKGDNPAKAQWLAKKTANLRIFSDEEGKLNLSLADLKGEALVISQFTLYANCNKGLRPGFEEAAGASLAEELYLEYIAALKKEGIEVKTGVFQADMLVRIANDGPVTIMLEK